ncbi:hypothetical protein QJS04_geneDACA013649 [Acorus gramineus]|uniref:Pectinesterase inhibitor domain-containing protein n=1 Tax=Acorus gramineus TaxID=55184 RepID=A0AAV9AVD5_ACOGR|nr:hypothetical protein QJS04_geneDACA013649 [Acorus gramineus]
MADVDLRLPTALVLLLLSAVQYSSADLNFIYAVCSDLTLPSESDDCVRFLKLDQRSYDATTQEELSSIALDIITKNYTRTRDFLNEMSIHHQREPIQLPCDECVSYYDLYLTKLQDAKALLAKKAYNDASLLVDKAASAPNICDSAFNRADIPSPVKQTDAYLLIDSNVTRDLIRDNLNKTFFVDGQL